MAAAALPPSPARAATTTPPAAKFAQSLTACTGATPCATRTTAKAGSLHLKVATTVGTTKLSSAVSVHGPNITVSAAATNGASATATSSVTYYVQVIGPQAVQVPLIATFTWTLSNYTDAASTPPYDQAAIAVNMNINADKTTRNVTAVSCPFTAACTALNTGYNVSVLSSTTTAPAKPTKLVITATGYANPTLDGATAEIGGATVKAKLVVDPSFPNAKLYSVSFSPGLTGG